MRIESAQVSLASQHSHAVHHTVQESVRTTATTTRLTLSPQARPPAQARDAAAPSRAKDARDDADVDPKLRPLIRLIEALTGRPLRHLRAEPLQAQEAQAAGAAMRQAVAARAPAPTPASGPTTVRTHLSYERRELYHEAESTQVQAQGVVKTADGREIRFDLSLSMQREFFQYSSTSLRVTEEVQLKDPLVLHFDGPAAALSDLRFSFDLDADGSAESLRFVGPGSGFLVLDRNANGRIDDGREMFGALSGDGFAELAALDSDGNGWIDENDPAFAQLQVWRQDAQGRNRFLTLAEAQVGALYLGRVASPFGVRDGANQTLAQVRSTGLYLREDGQAGAMQQIDLAV